MNGITHKVDSVIELTHAQEQLKSIKENVEKVGETPPVPVKEPKAPDSSTTLPPKTIMAQYTVKEAFELEGVNQEVDTVVELSDEKAAELGEKVEKVGEEGNAPTPADSDPGV